MASEVEQVLHMNEGVGETSYAKNSSFQKKVMMRVKSILEESINNMFCSNLPITCLKVADLGCSSGPNAFLLASNIMDVINETSHRLKVEPPICQFFLNDLFGNDFNSIFKSLPDFYGGMKQETTCLINATPGTFYGTLFPSNSIHFFHSSYSLHWLSQAPNLVSEEANIGDDDDKRNIYVTSISPPSYAKQFKQGFKVFLRSRSKELVPNGGMLLTFIGRYDTSQHISAIGLIRVILNDMILEDLIEESKLEHFKAPVYFARADEVKEIIKEEGSFSIERLESIRTSWDGSSLDDKEGSGSLKDENERGKFVAKYLRAVLEPILKAHLGEGIMDELFLRLENKVVQLLPKLVYPTLVISLTKIAA